MPETPRKKSEKPKDTEIKPLAVQGGSKEKFNPTRDDFRALQYLILAQRKSYLARFR